MIRIAIDGPGGAGKSSVAKQVARKMDIEYIDTGAMYRAVGWKALSEGIDPKDEAAVSEMLPRTDINFEHNHIILDGEDISGKIRTPEVSRAASACSGLGCVREKLVAAQRKIADGKSVIMDGRDIGTNVLPNAEVKIYMDADPMVRAERRWKELREAGKEADLQAIADDIRNRDAQDMNRKLNPLRKAEDAVYLDTSELTFDETVQSVLDIIGNRNEQ